MMPPIETIFCASPSSEDILSSVGCSLPTEFGTSWHCVQANLLVMSLQKFQNFQGCSNPFFGVNHNHKGGLELQIGHVALYLVSSPLGNPKTK